MVLRRSAAIYAAVTNTGSIAVASGTLGFYGGGSFGGSISGAGTVAFTGGTSTLSATTTSANLLVNGGTLVIAATETVSGPFSGTSGLVTVATGATLKLTGTTGFDNINAYGPSISGPGTLSTAGATTLATQTAAYVDLYVGGGGTWTNSGTATIGGQIDFGLAPADHTSFINQAGGVFDLIDDYADVVAYTSYDTATFTNAGLLEKTGGSSVSAIYAAVTNTGSIAVASGTLGFYGGGSFGGSISGAGTVAFTGGTSTLSATTTSANLLVNGGTLVIAATETVSGPFSGTSGLVTVAMKGATLKLTSTHQLRQYKRRTALDFRARHAQHCRCHHAGGHRPQLLWRRSCTSAAGGPGPTAAPPPSAVRSTSVWHHRTTRRSSTRPAACST